MLPIQRKYNTQYIDSYFLLLEHSLLIYHPRIRLYHAAEKGRHSPFLCLKIPNVISFVWFDFEVFLNSNLFLKVSFILFYD